MVVQWWFNGGSMVVQWWVNGGSYKVVPQFGIAKLVRITPVTWVSGKYLKLVNGANKPTNITMGAPPCSCKYHLRGGTRKVGKQERNRRKNEGERAGKKT